MPPPTARRRPAGLVAAALSALLWLAAAPASAQTLRWASQGDAQTMDPHSQNELLTNSINGQVYETLVNRDRKLDLEPVLATEWSNPNPLTWRFKLRPNVKFHDGTPFTADDVVFSVQRAREGTSDLRAYANALGTPRRVDALTVEFALKDPNPIFLQHLATIQIMSKAWCEKHKATRPQDFKNKEEMYTAFNANGTGPYVLVSRAPDVKTVYRRNPAWWGRIDGNVQEVVYTPIKSDATRIAALISGEIDFVLDPAPQDVQRLRGTAGVKVVDGPENRIVFIGMDQARDELLYGSKGRNPFKDVRVRRALYQAIDIETIKTRLMRNQAYPTGGITPSPLGAYNDPEIEKRLPYDLEAAKKGMAEAGFANGFEVTLDCPNNRYINDEEICQTLAAMWAKLNVKVRVNAMPRSTYFPKVQKFDTSMYMLGWGGSITDAETTLTPVLRNRGEGGVGAWNFGGYVDAKLDELAAASSREPDPKKREQLVKAALKRHNEEVHHLPLHRQVIPWAARQNVELVHRADNWLEWRWVSVK
ncbi:ABC transporter substrate-binding protein [Piscinibacter sakaiensis]|uniref:Putative binding-protein-dependent transport protein (Periplasmic) n=1 Tax=Piscinibacter sakaiensis TaxID=1547922 RepID=A0A0K8P7C4_PISS1|nr:ABC transporter substrate-binding protein [Piscinibacter sakaiensis]GAP38526.1 putative binding-protein-dependent transport protein (periplasmic) [Piscinibacter sakaiensis]